MKRLLLSLFVASAMISCTKTEELTGTEGPQEIKLSAGVIAMETKAIISGSAFADNTVIGLYGMKKDVTDWTTPYFNNKGTKVVAGGGITFDPEKIYYPQDDKSVVFYAFYPNGTPTNNGTNAPTVVYDLTQQDDILWATVETGTLSNHAEKTLQFAHKLAQINFKVKAGEGFTPGVTNVTNIEIKNTNTTATLNIETGVLAFTNLANLTAFTGTQLIESAATATAFGTVMIQPEALYTITVTAGGIEYEKTLTAPAAGEAKTVTLTFLATGVDAKAAITDWAPTTEDAVIQK